jgi:SAM-dependent methyltransferase
VDRKQRESQALIGSLQETSPTSAAIIVPLLMDLTGAQSVLDVGCGIGAWLEEFRRAGVEDYLGMDALDREHHPTLAPEHFRKTDLADGVEIDRTFDLTICLEVGEHLPADSADRLVEALVQSAPVVVFSAAIPHQGGVGHLNEQWPEYWRTRFEARNYQQHDVLRPAIWFDERVAWWYRQNAYIYAKVGWQPSNSLASRAIDERVVHPALFELMATRAVDSFGLTALLRALPRVAFRASRRRLVR